MSYQLATGSLQIWKSRLTRISISKVSGKERVSVKPKQISQLGDDDGDGLPFPSATRNSLTQEHRRQGAMSPPRSSMFGAHKGRRQVVVDSDSETPVEEDGAVTDSDGEGPLKQETPRRDRVKPRPLPNPVVTISSNEGDGDENDSEEQEEEEDSENEVRVNVRSSQSLPNLAAPEEDDDDDDLPIRTPRSSMPRPRGRQNSDADEDEDEDEDIQTPAKRRRLTRHKAAPAPPESDSDASSADSTLVTSRSSGRGKDKASSSPPASTARSMRSGARRHRTQREKRIELLKRHRAGERHLTIEDINTSEEEVDGALYDTDSDHQVLDVFEDESETEEPPPQTQNKKKKSKNKEKKEKKSQRTREASVLDEDADSEDENFIDDDDDTLGVPDEALHLIPLEFTRASTKPLKLHFKDAVEWLIHRRINPGFDKDNEVYVTAWRKLSDEVTGLANSKFISSVWRPDFHKALKARPYIEQEELGASALASEFENCQACGRSGHPATWTIRPWGKPYDPKTLDEVDSDSDDEDEDDDDDEEHGDRGKFLLFYLILQHLVVHHTPYWYRSFLANTFCDVSRCER